MKTHEKLLLEASLAGLAALGGLVFLVAPGRASKKDKKPFMYKNFAHRGLHKRIRPSLKTRSPLLREPPRTATA